MARAVFSGVSGMRRMLAKRVKYADLTANHPQ